MNLDSIGFHWPYATYWLWAFGLAYVGCLFWHSRRLFRSTTRKEALKLTLLRGCSGLLFLLLIARPFIDRMELNPEAIRVVSLVDLSGSMNEKDLLDGPRRVEQVRPFLSLDQADSWINRAREKYGTVERFGFTSDDIFSVRSSSWTVPEQGKDTSLGDALFRILESTGKETLGAVVLFSDGRNNAGKSPLEVGEKFREGGIPINVVGVGKIKELGNLSVSFSDFPTRIVAKEEVVFSADVKNEFAGECKTVVRLLANDQELEARSLNLGAGESRTIRFSPHIPEVAGIFTYRVIIDLLEGDFDPSDNADEEVVQVHPPAFFSVFYLSHQVTPFYPSLKRSLAGDRFQLSSLIRLGEKTFHARGEKVSPGGYPEEPDFWMQYDVVLLDSGCLNELNATMVSSLKDFIQKRGGGLLLLGDAGVAKEALGGLMPAIETQPLLAKQDLSLHVLADPLFTELKRVDEWKPFLPAGMPAELITRINPAAREVVSLKGNSARSLLALQAYGAGKSAYWGSPHDWKRSLADEENAREFSLFWCGVVEWLGSGTVNRVKVEEPDKVGSSGEKNHLLIDVLGQDFEPSFDARIEANITGPNEFSKTLQLYPQGGALGRYAGSFIPPQSGSYRIDYQVQYPDGEKLEHLSYLKIKQSGDEAKDTRYARRELRMLANLTGGEFVEIDQMSSLWTPQLSTSLPMVKKRNNLADSWPIFLTFFLIAGYEWIIRRKGGLK